MGYCFGFLLSLLHFHQETEPFRLHCWMRSVSDTCPRPYGKYQCHSGPCVCTCVACLFTVSAIVLKNFCSNRDTQSFLSALHSWILNVAVVMRKAEKIPPIGLSFPGKSLRIRPILPNIPTVCLIRSLNPAGGPPIRGCADLTGLSWTESLGIKPAVWVWCMGNLQQVAFLCFIRSLLGDSIKSNASICLLVAVRIE